MKAVVYEEYGLPEVLELKEVEKPNPKAGEVLVKVKASTVTAGVSSARSGTHPHSKLFTFILRLMFGLTKPRKKILGYEFAGEVVAVGEKVTKFKIGDSVFGTTTGLKAGAYAEYVCVPEKWNNGVIALKPENLSDEQSAAVPVGGMTALYLLKKANIQPEQKILIYGASGSVGSYAVQLAKYFGGEVSAVCSASNLEWVKSIGADEVIDYTQQDMTELESRFDLIFDAVGLFSKSKYKHLLSDNGVYTSTNSPTSEKTDDLLFLKKLIEQEKIKPVIDKTFPMDKIVEAHRYVDQGHKKGNVVIKIANE